MRSTRQRVFSLLLALVLMVGLLPVGAWAAGTEGDTVTVEVRFDFRSVGEPAALEGTSTSFMRPARHRMSNRCRVFRQRLSRRRLNRQRKIRHN